MIYAFGDYELDTRGYELRRAGQTLPVAPQVLEFLAYLIQHQGQVISKAALLEELWPDRYVSDWALAYCVKAARRAIDDSGRTSQFIRTVRARGYAFVAPVETRQAGEDGAQELPSVPDQAGPGGAGEGMRRGARYALLIDHGVCPPDDHGAGIEGPERDVDGLAAVLTDTRIASFHTVQRLQNVSHQDVRDVLFELTQTVQKEDLVLVYFTGHARPDTQGRLYLATLNTQFDRLGDTALALEQVKDLIDACPSTRIILIFDCCFHTETGGSIALDTVEKQMHEVASGRGKYILSTSPRAPHSALAPHLIEGLRTGHADIDQTGAITLDQLYHYACTKMLQVSETVPLKWDLSGKGGLTLARTRRRPAAEGLQASAAGQAHYDAIAQLLKKGEVILCLGPGLVEYGQAAHPPREEELAQRLAEAAGFADRDQPYTLIAQQIEIVAGRGVLYDNLRDLFQPEPYIYQPAPIHRLLARLPEPCLILSTAYDTLLEEAFDEADKKYAVVTYILHGDTHTDRGKVAVRYSDRKETVEKYLAQELAIDLSQWSVIYKMHGTFGLFDPHGDEEIDSLVITEEDYLALVTLLEHPQTTIPNALARQFKKCMFLFLGYSIGDWNRRAVLDVLQRKGNFGRIRPYAVRQGVTEFERLYWESKRVRVLETGLLEFMDELADALGIDV